MSDATRVITRSFDGKPTSTIATFVDPTSASVIVGNAEATGCIKFKSWDVFKYDTVLFSRLEHAYLLGHEQELKDLWSKACLFYKD